MCLILDGYRVFPVRYELDFYVNLLRSSVFKGLRKTDAGVEQGNVLRPVLYLIYTSDLPTSGDTMQPSLMVQQS
jgi:hypothetical protein